MSPLHVDQVQLKRRHIMLLRPLLVAGLALTTIAACDSNDGPLEEAGENLDNAVEETTDEMEEATD
jgi:hypothetical protein